MPGAGGAVNSGHLALVAWGAGVPSAGSPHRGLPAQLGSQGAGKQEAGRQLTVSARPPLGCSA